MAVQRAMRKRRGPSRYKVRDRTLMKPYGPSRIRRFNPIPRVPVRNGFPNQYYRRLKYVDEIGLVSNTGAVVGNTFRMNSLFDPDLTGTGHQPMYFDQLAAVYDRYFVYASTIKVTYTIEGPTSTTANLGPCHVGVIMSGETVSLQTPFYTNEEQSDCDVKVLGNPQGGTNSVTCYGKFNARQVLDTVDDDTAGAAVSGSPTRVWYAQLYACDRSLAGATAVSARVEITFNVRFHSPKSIPSS